MKVNPVGLSHLPKNPEQNPVEAARVTFKVFDRLLEVERKTDPWAELPDRRYSYTPITDTYVVKYRVGDHSLTIVRRIGDTLRSGTDGVPFSFARMNIERLQRSKDGEIVTDGDPERFTPMTHKVSIALDAEQFADVAAFIESTGSRFIDSKNVFKEPTSVDELEGVNRPRRPARRNAGGYGQVDTLG